MILQLTVPQSDLDRGEGEGCYARDPAPALPCLRTNRNGAVAGAPGSLFASLCAPGDVSGATKVPLTSGTHLVGLGEEVHGVRSLEEVHQGETVVEGRVAICVAFCLQEEGAVRAVAGHIQAVSITPNG